MSTCTAPTYGYPAVPGTQGCERHPRPSAEVERMLNKYAGTEERIQQLEEDVQMLRERIARLERGESRGNHDFC